MNPRSITEGQKETRLVSDKQKADLNLRVYKDSL